MFGVRRPPARLAKLEIGKKKKKELTQEQIERKLARAEQRRKVRPHPLVKHRIFTHDHHDICWFQEREQQRLQRIQEVTNKSDVQNALDSFAQTQQEKDEQEQSKQDIAAENRERRMREMREKLRVKQERIDAARRRKLAASLDETAQSQRFDEDEEVDSPFVAKPKLARENPAYTRDDDF